MKEKQQNTHGGYREGAGRPCKYSTVSSVIRVPITQKKNIQVQMDMFSAYLDNREYKYSAHEIYEVLDQLNSLIYDVQKRIKEDSIRDMDTLNDYQQHNLKAINLIF